MKHITLFLVFSIFRALLLNNHAQDDQFDALEWRFIGPIAGNRGSVVLGHPTEKKYFLSRGKQWFVEDRRCRYLLDAGG